MSQEAPHHDALLTVIARLKEELATARSQAFRVNDLFTEAIDRPHAVNLWSLCDRELDQRLARLLSFQNSDMDPHPLPHHITSHRRRLGPYIVAIKRFVMKLLRPITGPLLTPQQQFNQMGVEYNLGTYIRIQQLDQRLGKLEEAVQRMEIGILARELTEEKA
jgi:hypothetical protein